MGAKKPIRPKGRYGLFMLTLEISDGLMVSMVQKVSGNAIMRISVRTQKGPPMGDLYGRFLCIL